MRKAGQVVSVPMGYCSCAQCEGPHIDRAVARAIAMAVEARKRVPPVFLRRALAAETQRVLAKNNAWRSLSAPSPPRGMPSPWRKPV